MSNQDLGNQKKKLRYVIKIISEISYKVKRKYVLQIFFS